jgi:type VI secretion system secreted protein VgrG
MTASQDYTLSVDGQSDVDWVIGQISGTEQIDRCFVFEVVCMPSGAGLTRDARDKIATSILTKSAKLEWTRDDGSRRTVNAIVESVDAAQESWLIVLAPRLVTLDDSIDHQIFLDQDAAQICKAVLSQHQIDVDNRVVRTLPKRAQCVQAFESDLAFVSRLLSEEGVTWFVDPTKADGVVFADSPSGFPALPGDPIPVVDTEGMVTGTRAFDIAVSQRIVPNKASLRDFNFETPAVDLSASATADKGELEVYRYRANYTTAGAGTKIAGVRLDGYRARRRILRGSTNARYLVPGSVVALSSDRSDVNGKWLLLEVTHRATENQQSAEERRYEASFVAVPAATPYRPEVAAESPTLGGVQTMTVTGPSGSEIHTQGYGQVKAHFRWDRQRPMDDTSSAWLRVVQPPTSGGFMLPRTGWEVLSTFWGTSGDVPIELGRLYNGQSPPPSAQPGNKVVSAFGSCTTPGGGSANLLQTNDTAGNEAMNLHASKDFNEKTENDKATNVTATDTHTVGGNRTLSVGQVHSVKIAASQTYSIGASRTVNVGANHAIEAGSETVSIGALRAFNVAGDSNTQCATLGRAVGASKLEACIEHQSILVSGASARSIGAGWTQLAGLASNVNVGGAQTEEVSGAKSIKAPKYGLNVKGALTESYSSRDITSGGEVEDCFGASCTFDVSGDVSMKGADVLIMADDKITIKADGITITITDGNIKIDGKFDSSQASKDKDDVDYD